MRAKREMIWYLSSLAKSARYFDLHESCHAPLNRICFAVSQASRSYIEAHTWGRFSTCPMQVGHQPMTVGTDQGSRITNVRYTKMVTRVLESQHSASKMRRTIMQKPVRML